MNDSVRVPQTPMMFLPNPFGGGWCLAINRGIPCEGHTHILSCHATNTPDTRDVQAVIDQIGDDIAKSWNAFVDMVSAYNAVKQNFEAMEPMAILWMQAWCSRVVDMAESEFDKRHKSGF